MGESTLSEVLVVEEPAPTVVLPDGTLAAFLVPTLLDWSARVVDPEGAPVPGVTVSAWRGPSLAGRSRSDQDGRLHLSLSPEAHLVELQHPDFEPREDIRLRWAPAGFAVEGAADEPPFVLVPRPTASLTGFLRSPLPVDDWPDRAFVTLVGPTQRVASVVNHDEDGLGRFELHDLPPGPYELVVNARGHHAPPLHRALEPGPNPALDEPPLVIALRPERVLLERVARLEGAVLDHADIRVQALLGDRLVATTLTDADGRFSLALTPEAHVLNLSYPGFLTQEVRLPWDGEAFEAPPTVATLVPTPGSDLDRDGVLDDEDNCPLVFNADQSNLDGDLLGDRCDADMDDDLVPNAADNCPRAYNPMQEDPDGDGRGVTCAGVDHLDPLPVACRVNAQHLDTRDRSHHRLGTCGGHDAPELVYRLFLNAGERVRVRVDADHGLALYMTEVASGEELDCVSRTGATFTARATGFHDVVVDGRGGPLSAGPVVVDLQRQSCSYALRGTGQLGVGALPRHVITADVDDDGEPDLITADHDGGTVSVLINNGGGRFRAAAEWPAGPNPFRVAAADLDGDGVLDLVVANEDGAGGQGHILRGLGGGRFEAPHQVRTGGGGTLDVVVADLDDDGRPDLAFADLVAGTVAVQLNLGMGRFDAPLLVETAPQPTGLWAAEVTGDGHLDLLVGHLGGAEVSVHAGDGDGGFGPRVPYATGPSPVVVRTGDLDEDGRLDIVSADLAGGSVTVHGSLSGRRTLEVAAEPDHVSVVDLDEDGHLDLVITHRAPGLLSVLTGRGDGTFDALEPLPVGARPHAAAVEDLDGDGLVDVAVANSDDDEVRILGGAGGGRLRATRDRVPVGFQPRAVAVGDLDADGHSDMVVVHWEDRQIQQRPPGRATVLMGRADGDFDLREVVEVGPDPIGPALLDADADGDLDVVVPSSRGDDVRILWNDGEGNLAPSAVQVGEQPHDVAALEEGFAVLTRTGREIVVLDAEGRERGRFPATEDQALELVSGDLDRDGDLDLVAVDLSAAYVFHQRDGDFGPVGGPIPVGSGPFSATLGDLNRDGLLDLVTANLMSDTVSVLLGVPAGTLGPARHYPAGDGPQGVVVQDVDGDGWKDIVTANFQGDDLTVLRGRGDGTFELPLSYATGDASLDVALLPRAGRPPDLVTVNDLGADLTIVRPAPQRAFSAPIRVDLGGIPLQVATADIDGDDLEDVVAVGQSGPANVVALLNAGDGGRFERAWDASLPGLPRAVVVAELIGDGWPDLAVVSAPPDELNIFPGLGEGRFGAPVTVPVCPGPVALAAANIAGDAQLELLVTAFSCGTIGGWERDGAAWRQLDLAPHLDPEMRVAAGANARGLAVADLDGDQHLDLATVSSIDNHLYVEFGRADGRYDGPVGYAVGLTPMDVRAVDLDLDGTPDLVSVSSNGADAAVLMNRGGRDFAPLSLTRLGGAAERFAVADMDGDDLPDLVVAIRGQSRVEILLGLGNGRFRPPLSLPVDAGSSAVAVGQLNADDTPDVVTGTAEGVAVFFNREGAAPAETPGTRRFDAPLPRCPAMEIPCSGEDACEPEGNRAVFMVRPPAPCRVERLELWVEHAEGDGVAALWAELGGVEHPRTQLAAGAEQPGSGLWRPEALPGLARFEGSPARGRWVVEAPGAVIDASMRINVFEPQ